MLRRKGKTCFDEKGKQGDRLFWAAEKESVRDRPLRQKEPDPPLTAPGAGNVVRSTDSQPNGWKGKARRAALEVAA
jgi:hypothetical protein